MDNLDNPEKVKQKALDVVAAGRQYAKQHNLTLTQLDVLRSAARKYDNTYGGENAKPHNGEVNTYNVRQDTLDILRQRGLIATGYRINDESQRAYQHKRIEELILTAWGIARNTTPHYKANAGDDAGLESWRCVLMDLTTADNIRKALNEKCLLITDTGRDIAKGWKNVIGAMEE